MCLRKAQFGFFQICSRVFMCVYMCVKKKGGLALETPLDVTSLRGKQPGNEPSCKKKKKKKCVFGNVSAHAPAFSNA